MEIERRLYNSGEIEAREDDGKYYLKGYALKFDALSRSIGWGFREKFDKRAFDEFLSKDFNNVEFDTIARFDHRGIIGRRSSGTLNVGVDDSGLWYEVQLPDTTLGNDLRELVKRGDVRHNSFAFITDQDVWEKSDGESIRTVTKVSYLKDVSPVIDPAYVQSEGIDVAKRSFENWEAETQDIGWQAASRARLIFLQSKQLNN